MMKKVYAVSFLFCLSIAIALVLVPGAGAVDAMCTNTDGKWWGSTTECINTSCEKSGYLNEFVCGDVTGDGRVSGGDISRLRYYLYHGGPMDCSYCRKTAYVNRYDLSYYLALDPPMPKDWYSLTSDGVRMTWNFTNATVWADGVLIDCDNDVMAYVDSGLTARSEHIYHVYDPENETLWSCDVELPYSQITFLYLVVFSLGLMALFRKNVIIAIFNFLLSMWILRVGMSCAQGDAFIYVIAGSVVLLALYGLYSRLSGKNVVQNV